MPKNVQTPKQTRIKHALLASALTFGVVGSAIVGTALLPNHAVAVSEATSQSTASVAPFSFADMVDDVKGAVVSVKVTGKAKPRLTSFNDRKMPNQFGEGHPFRKFFDQFGEKFEPRNNNQQPQRQSRSQGSGFFISTDGYVVTNHHVIANGNSFDVVLSDGNTYEAELIGSDAKTDLALLKVNEADVSFKTVSLATDNPRVGDWVVAVGNPFGLGGTVTAGIVSAHGREIGASIYDDFLQIDAPVNKGNSGGPTFNTSGQVIGVNTAIFSPSGGNVGIAFAIPAETVKTVIADLKEDGVVERGWLGVQIQSLTEDLASALSLDTEKGAMVTTVNEGSPAEAAGIKVGDVILSIDGDTIDDPKDLARTVGSVAPGKSADMRIWRDGKDITLAVELGTLDQPEVKKAEIEKPVEAEKARLGIQIAPARDGKGVVIAGVEPNSPAQIKGLRQGQKLLSINGTKVETPDALIAEVNEARNAGKESVIIQLETPRGPRFVAVPFSTS